MHHICCVDSFSDFTKWVVPSSSSKISQTREISKSASLNDPFFDWPITSCVVEPTHPKKICSSKWGISAPNNFRGENKQHIWVGKNHLAFWMAIFWRLFPFLHHHHSEIWATRAPPWVVQQRWGAQWFDRLLPSLPKEHKSFRYPKMEETIPVPSKSMEFPGSLNRW